MIETLQSKMSGTEPSLLAISCLKYYKALVLHTCRFSRTARDTINLFTETLKERKIPRNGPLNDRRNIATKQADSLRRVC